MKPNKKIYSICLAIWLLGVLVVQSAHQFDLLGHTHHTIHCNADHQHDEDRHHHSHNECDLCEFHFYASTVPTIFTITSITPSVYCNKNTYTDTQYQGDKVAYTTLRAPPSIQNTVL